MIIFDGKLPIEVKSKDIENFKWIVIEEWKNGVTAAVFNEYWSSFCYQEGKNNTVFWGRIDEAIKESKIKVI